LIKNLRDHSKHRDRQWVDRPQTTHAEELGDLLAIALQEAVTHLRDQFGPDFKNWRWQEVRPTSLPHVSRFPGLGEQGLEVPGSRYTVNANQGHHGPTWRMIVSFEPEPKGWGNLPGGTSGNPFDPDYTRFVKDWSKGKLREFRRYQTASEAVREAQTRWSFRPQEVSQ
jgi:penicillin amidase